MIPMQDSSGSAFPYSLKQSRGMSIRDYFAAAALTGLIASPNKSTIEIRPFASDAYAYADAMIAERLKASSEPVERDSDFEEPGI